MKNKRLYYYLPIIFALLLIIGVFIGSKLLPIYTSNRGLFSTNLSKYDKINDIINYIEKDYVDTIVKNQLSENAILGILQNLDPHSAYIPASDLQGINDELSGRFEGIGIQFIIYKDTITVVKPVKGGPSEESGVKAGDRIIEIEGKNVAGTGIKNEDVLQKLKGKQYTKVNIKVFRRKEHKTINFTITRNIIPTFSVDISYMLKKDIAYIKVSRFSATTHTEFVKSLKELKNSGMQKLILDLRGNGGGYLNEAHLMADEFFEKDKLIVYTEGKNRTKEMLFSTSNGNFKTKPLVILIDDMSASASEIVAGAIQDNDRGIIIGRRSFGKGLVQEQLTLLDSSAIRLTVARYYTPSGRCIQKTYNNGNEEYYNDIYDRFLNGEMDNKDSIVFQDSLQYKTTKGRIVYGGGGIMPDIFVPLGFNNNSEYFKQLINKNLIYEFAFNYTDSHRSKLEKYSNFDNFNEKFIISSKTLNEFIRFAEKNDVSPNNSELIKSKQIIKTRLKAFIGRNVYGDEGFYPIIHKTDKTVIQAIKHLEN